MTDSERERPSAGEPAIGRRQTVGFVGLGNMGWPMAHNLAGAGVELVLYDAAPGRAETFARQVGGHAAPSLEALAKACPIVITMLPDGDAVRDVLLGSGGDCLLTGMAEGSLLIDMGSSDPLVYRDIGPALERCGAQLVDAPVSGGVKGAQAAALAIMAGGQPDAIERALPLLEILGASVFRTGALGTGQAMKALNNLASAGALALTIEVLLIGQRFGLDAWLMTEILNASTGRNNSTDKKIVPHVLSRRFDSGFALSLMAKDVATALSLARSTGTPAALSEHVLETARQALQALGQDADHTALARFLESRAGDELHPAPVPDSSEER